LVEDYFTEEKGYRFDADIIYGDTDSVMMNFGNVTIQEAIKLGQEAAIFISQFFCPPIHLEFEKTYHPYLLISMKRHSGLLWTNSNKPDRIDAKGIETVRRDNCQLVQHLIQISLNKLMYNQEFMRMIKTFISELLKDRIDLSLLIISKSLSKDDYKTQAPHTMLAKKLPERDQGSAPRVGDRIPYIIVEGNKSSKIYERGEDPMFALQNRLQIDSHYYLENQLKKPIMRIFKNIIGEEEAAKLFQGKHAMKKKVSSINTEAPTQKGTLMGFVAVQSRCLCGKNVVKKGQNLFASNVNILFKTYIKKIEISSIC
jgi:DNA polymerase delta subunit 1